MAATTVVAEGRHVRERGCDVRCFGHAVHGAVRDTRGGHRTHRRRHVPAHVSANRRKNPRHGLKRQHENKQQDEQTAQHVSHEANSGLWILTELLAERLK